ncbi:MAG: RsmD family RNA methyltransferase, partial [Gammaproteobacteria bacterium]|nr:RsmD family RNA methyltransferase [Gammaproteobacteria bacterium]
GTGALGLEALSRGADSTVFVEKSMPAVGALIANINTLGAEGAVVQQMDALDYLSGENAGRFDLVFLDPPFATDMVDKVCRLLDERKMLADDACIYIEQERSKAEPELPEGWEVLKNKTAGNVRYMLVGQKT